MFKTYIYSSIALLTIFDKIILRSSKVLYRYSISNRYNLENQRIKYTSSSDVYTPHDTNTKSPILFSHLLSLTRNCTQGRTVHTLWGSGHQRTNHFLVLRTGSTCNTKRYFTKVLLSRYVHVLCSFLACRRFCAFYISFASAH